MAKRRKLGGRQPGKPWYPGKSKGASYYVTMFAYKQLRAAARRTGKSDSDIIEFCIRGLAGTITKQTEPAAEPLEVAR